MDEMKRIMARLAPEMRAMNGIIERTLATSNPVMNSIVTRYLEVKGKQIRPLLVILSAGMFGKVTQEVLLAGAALEMLHNASLIHDDIVDETMLRRGGQTVNARMGNHVAVLVGDFFVSNALAAAIQTGNVKAVTALSALGKELSLGEIDQLSYARDHALDESAYFKMIRQKTASLFMNCAGMGADIAGASAQQRENLVAYAELLGLAFQIRDDIFDYFDSGEIGKPTGNDLREGKVTLPLLHALEAAPAEEASPMRELLLRGDLSAGEIETLIAFAKRHGGIEYSLEKMKGLQRDAKGHLEALPPSEARTDFEAIFDYIISRSR